MIDTVVVGSGPAGVACSLALLEKGHSVTMLDAGLTLDSPTETRVRQLRASPPEQWPAGATDFMYVSSGANVRGVTRKKLFGSDLPYQNTERDIPLRAESTALLPSFAQGGLSTVWGAAILPLRRRDMQGWPIQTDDLAPHYRAILNHIPFAATHDDLEKQFPLYTDNATPFVPSRQAKAFLDDLRDQQGLLAQNHISYGLSRLALWLRAPDQAAEGCVYCGQCLVGCPYDAIYSSAHTLAVLRKHERFQYRPGWVVKEVHEAGDGVTVMGLDLNSRAPQSVQAQRVFLGAGVIPTTQILLRSLKAYDRPVAMATSQHFMFPWLRHDRIPDVDTEFLHTLSQVFMEMDDPAISDNTVHLQFYTYNALMKQALRRLGIGYLLEWSRALRTMVYGRLLVTQGYLHSKDSGHITVTLHKENNAEPILSLKACALETTSSRIRQVLQHLEKLKDVLRARPLARLLTISPLGGGFHAGGTFPMKENPQPFESDPWGRPHGFQRVHAVDATVFPNIAATTITLNVMANAHRIGSFHE